MKEQKQEEYFDRGIQTFMKSDYVGLDELENYDVAFIGAPVEFGATFRKGMAEAPSEIRKYSYWDTISGEEYYDINEGRVLKSNNIKIADLGDIHVNPANPKQTGKRILETIKKIRSAGVFPVTIGGDHSIAYHTIKGCFEGCPHGLRKKDIAVVHMDAHMDLESSYLDYPDIYHGNSFRRLIDDGVIKGTNLFSIGIRGLIQLDIIQYAKKQQINIYPAMAIRKNGMAETISDIKQKLAELKIKATYISFDIDCITPTEVKGTGTPVDGGLYSEEIFYFMRNLYDMNTVGFEIVELAPKIDQTGFSTLTAVNILRNFLMFGLKNKGKIK